nr:hypothetical protein [Tanacetum cinerariifolium]
MDQQNPTLAKIPILDTGRFEQWQFRIQQYLQHEHYALWEVIEFRDSYEAPDDVIATGLATGKKKGRTIALTTEDIKYKTAQELWAAILKIFGGNKATKKTMKNLLKQQYGNFKAEGSKTLEQTFNRLQAIVSHLEFMDIEIEQDDLNQKFLTMECFNCYKMGHFTRKYRAPRSQDRGRRDNYRQGSKVKEQTPKALMAINGVGWDWSFMANEQEDHALVADEEAPTKFALMAKTSAKSEVFDNSLRSKTFKKNTDSLNSKITELTDKLSDTKNTLYHYKLGLSQVESRLVEFKNQEVKYYEKIRGIEFKVEARANRIECLTNELELLKKEKEVGSSFFWQWEHLPQ